jgi:hypothetical protein
MGNHNFSDKTFEEELKNGFKVFFPPGHKQRLPMKPEDADFIPLTITKKTRYFNV